MSKQDTTDAVAQAQLKLLELLTARLAVTGLTTPNDSATADHIVRHIPDFHHDADAGVSFESWYKRYEDVFTIELASFDDETKVRLLLRKLGPAEHVRYSNYILPAEARALSFSETIQTLKKIFGQTTSLFNARFNCLQVVKKDSEDFVTYGGWVNRECERFCLGSLTEDQFRCLVFVCGLRSPRYEDIRTRLLAKIDQEPNIKLQQLIDECERIANLKHDSAMIQQGAQQPTVHAAFTRKHLPSSSRPTTPPNDQRPPSPCKYCGAWHFHRFCPVRKSTQRPQRQQRRQSTSWQQRQQRKPQQPHSPNKPHPAKSTKPVGHSRSLVARFQTSDAAPRQYVNVHINGMPARLQLDTASDITIISKRAWKAIGSPKLTNTKLTATSASGGSVRLVAHFSCSMSFRDVTSEGVCYLADTPLDLLGLDWIARLHLLDLPLRSICNRIQTSPQATELPSHLLEQFPEVFKEGLGLCNRTEAILHLLPGAKPVFRPKRPMPYAALPLVDQELQRMEQLGIITPVSYSKWAAPIVVVKKANGSIRICADFSTGLNNALQPHCHPLPLPEDIFTLLNGGRYFATLDLAEAYFQIPVEQNSRELLTINTHRGLYQYTRLPFGVKTAPGIFQQVMDALTSGLQGTAAYLDDIIVVGQSPEELQQRLADLLQRIQDYGLKLQKDKCRFHLESIKYLGFIFDAQGRRPDPDNIDAIRKMPPPSDAATLRSFLGMISYYSAFVPALHNLRAPLNRLLMKDTKWAWTEDCDRAFNELKDTLTSDLLLCHFDPRLPISIAADASNYGVGAVISHTWPNGTVKPIAHVSRTLTPAEKNYSQIEKEALAIVFAVKKFHKYIYGRRFTLLTDHKPLLAIFGSKKGIPAYSANRLQRWSIILLAYDFTMEHCRTEDFGQADGLSRLPNPDSTSDDVVIAAVTTDDDTNQLLHDAVRGIPVTVADIRKASAADPRIRSAIKWTTSQWPAKVPSGELSQLFSRRRSLSVVDSCLMFADRVVIPCSLRQRVLRQLHKSHPGMGRMKSLARSFVYWPFMDRDIEATVRNCSRCQQAAKFPPKEEPSPWPTPKAPWSRVHVDYAGPINDNYYLVLVDSYSKWPEVYTVSSPTAQRTLACLRQAFAQHGLPEVIVSDNGTQFTSANFADFCQRLQIQHVRSPPYHPQSNGQAERFVDTFKRALLKSRGEGTNEEVLQQFLLAYRTTPNPICPNGTTPAEALMGRRLRTINHAMIPTEKVSIREQVPKQCPFIPGSAVYARDYRANHSCWTEGTIQKVIGRVLYEVAVGKEIWIRHKNQLRKRAGTSEPSHVEPGKLPLDLLLDTFNMPVNTMTTPTDVQTPNLLPRRWSDRPRRPTKRLQLNPRSRQYR